MKRLIAWDTSTKTGSVAALTWDPSDPAGKAGVRLVAEWTLDVDAAHSERLLWAVDRVLESAGWKIEEVDYLGVGIGPGSFTGLRIGMTTARTLAHTLGKRVVGVSSLAALARPASLWLSGVSGRSVVIAAADACKGELYGLWGSARSVRECVVLSQDDRQGLWKRGVEEGVLSPEALIKAIKKKLQEGNKATAWTVVGDAALRFPDLWKALPRRSRVVIEEPFLHQIQARNVGLLAWEGIQAGLDRAALEVQPRYLRAPDAERKLKAGLLPVRTEWADDSADPDAVPLTRIRGPRSSGHA